MSRLLRFSKLSPLNNVMKGSNFRWSSSSATTTSPYLLLGNTVKEGFPERGSNTADVLLLDPGKEKLFTVPDKTIPKELISSSLVGSSHEWGFFYEMRDGFLSSSDFLNPLASKSNPKVIPLSPLTTLPYNQTQCVRNVAMSSDSPAEEEDFVVAIKLLGCQISLYRHGGDLRWTHLELPFNCLDNSNLVYSKTDQCFYLPSSGGNCLCQFDLLDNQKVRELLFPELSKSELELLRSYSRAEQWVESSSGERFLVQWYSYDSVVAESSDIHGV